jgi:hypothetical protein
VVAGILPESGVLAISFQEVWKGKGDKQIMFAIDIGVDNVSKMAAGAPEPSEWLLLMVELGDADARHEKT